MVEARGHVHPLFLYGTDYIFYYHQIVAWRIIEAYYSLYLLS